MGILDGKVALVTGAGGGLGRAYALLFAREGAKVVVNDLGGTRDGHHVENTTAMADKVVAEIKEMGGEAVANYGSVSNADNAQDMVQQAIDAFGKLDIVVNNAGILRDRTLVKLTDEEWDIVIAVHLKGTYLVTKAAVLAMGENGGRIINTSSLAGLKGNFGQANYGAAKAGIAGLTRVVALETRKMGITVNAIAPVAKTRMTEDISMVPDAYEPEDIAPLVCWLASDAAADVTGRIFGAHGSHYFEYVTELTPGIDLGNDRWTPEMVGTRFAEITAKPKAAKPAASGGGLIEKARALFEGIPATYNAEKAGDWAAKIAFNLGGEASYSLIVGGGKTQFQDGAVAGATAKVEFDSPQTLLDMASGKLAPEQAFMSGKIKTDNMGALMKFGKYFDLAAAAGALGGAGGGADHTRTLFEALPATYKAAKAGDWAAKIVFAIGDEATYSLIVGAGKAECADGAVEGATGKVTFDSSATLLAMASGKLAPEQAFMSGKVTTDNMGILMKFGQYFDLAQAATALGLSGAPSRKGLNKDLVGRKYRGAANYVHKDEIIAYAAATDESNEVYTDVAPPIFPVRPLFKMLTDAISDPELGADMLRLVHGEQDMRFHRHLKTWDLVNPRAEIGEIETKSSGELITIRQWLMVDGEMTTEVHSGIFIRGESKGEKGAKAEAAPEPERTIVYSETQTVAADQPLRYALASLDMNPIHVDEEIAKAAGHPSVILHGLCTMAFAARAIVNGPCQKNPHSLKRIKVRFSRPVLPGWTLTTSVWNEGTVNGVTTFGFEVVNQDGVKVITNALAEVEI